MESAGQSSRYTAAWLRNVGKSCSSSSCLFLLYLHRFRHFIPRMIDCWMHCGVTAPSTAQFVPQSFDGYLEKLLSIVE
eukprot:scaffold240_cov369-Pavlova_lutheri.AAC.25